MSIARIIKDHSLSNTKSLVLLSVTEISGNITNYIAIVDHSAKPWFSAAEEVTLVEQEQVWLRRTMFNGRYADTIVNQKRAVFLDNRSITLEKTKEPDFKLPQKNIIG